MKTVFSNITKFLIVGLMIFSERSASSGGFNSVYSNNGNTVWVVGANGTIYRSFDAGQSFTDRSLGVSTYYSISGYNVSNIWISGSNGTVLCSTNSGTVYTTISTGINENFMSIYFTDIQSGWVCTGTGKIYKSTNSGINWILQSTPATNQLNQIKFINSTTGAACGNGGTFLTTTNGGNNWIQSVLPLNKDVLSFDIADNVIFASCSDAYVLKSTNLGSSWSVIDYLIKTRSDVTGIEMLSANTFYSTGKGGFIRRSTDGGESFTYQNNPAWADLDKIYFYDSLHGWAISKDMNLVLRTNNAGLNWYMPTGTVQTLSWVLKIPLNFYTSSGNVFYQSPWNKHEIFVTNANRIYRSLDVGESWNPIGTVMNYGAISNSLFVSPRDTNLILVAIDSIDNEHGKVLRSTNYGSTWFTTLSANRSSDGIPMAMDPNHPDTVYYGPTDSVIFRSTNFGLTWSAVSSYRFDNICAIKVPESSSNTILVGSASFLQNGKSVLTRSTDFGVTWTETDSNRGPYPEVPAVINSTLDPVMYITQYRGNEGGVKRTMNGGASWSFINIDESAWGFDIAKDDPNALVYAVWGYSGNIPGYISFNKGATFSPLPAIQLVNNFAVYYYNRSTLFLQQAIGFYKLKATFSIPIGIHPIAGEVPQKFALGQNYPNPFNPVTQIKIDLPINSFVSLKVFDALGREFDELLKEDLRAGVYSIEWNAASYPSGIYFYQLQTEKFTETRKMILIK